MRTIIALMINTILLGGGAHWAQATVLSTPFNGGNGANGEVFQIEALTDIVVRDFGVNAVDGFLEAGDITTWSVYQHNGFLSSVTAGAGIWTLIASGGAVMSAGANEITYLNSGLSVSIAAGTIEAFLILETSNLISYTNGGAVGNVEASNGDLRILQGWGAATNFSTFDPRQANISVVYTTGIPEPGSLGLLGLGAAAIAASRQRSAKRKAAGPEHQGTT